MGPQKKSFRRLRPGLLSFGFCLVCMLMFTMSGCKGRNKHVTEAKEALKSASAGTATDAATTPTAHQTPSLIDAERYLPVQERLRRRQERIRDVLAKHAPASPQAPPIEN